MGGGQTAHNNSTGHRPERKNMATKYTVSSSGIDAYIWDMRKAAWHLADDMLTGNKAIEAVVWYIRTGRASSDFLRAMFQHRPSTIAKRCLAGGSDMEIIERVKSYLKIA